MKIAPVVTEETPVTNTDIRIIIGALEAIGRSGRSITQHQTLSALRELLVNREIRGRIVIRAESEE